VDKHLFGGGAPVYLFFLPLTSHVIMIGQHLLYQATPVIRTKQDLTYPLGLMKHYYLSNILFSEQSTPKSLSNVEFTSIQKQNAGKNRITEG